MASTHCRAYDLTPADIEVRSITGGEVTVLFGDTIGIQGPPQQLHALLQIAAGKVQEYDLRLPQREPF